MQYVNALQPKYSAVDVTEVELPETDANSVANSDMERENENANMLLDVRILFEYSSRFVHLLDIKSSLSLGAWLNTFYPFFCLSLLLCVFLAHLFIPSLFFETFKCCSNIFSSLDLPFSSLRIEFIANT